MSEELEPCPFCGGGTGTPIGEDGSIFASDDSVACINDGCPISYVAMPRAKWNTRAPSPAAARVAELEREVAALREAAQALAAAYGVHRTRLGGAWFSTLPQEGHGDVWAKMLAALAPRSEA